METVIEQYDKYNKLLHCVRKRPICSKVIAYQSNYLSNEVFYTLYNNLDWEYRYHSYKVTIFNTYNCLI